MSNKTERDFLNDLPPTLVLESEAVDRLREGVGGALRESFEFKRLLQDSGSVVVTPPPLVKAAP